MKILKQMSQRLQVFKQVMLGNSVVIYRNGPKLTINSTGYSSADMREVAALFFKEAYKLH